MVASCYAPCRTERAAGAPLADQGYAAISSDNHKRSIAKAISWRATGTLDTFLISWVITGEPLLATGIAGTELATKITLYYLHERLWSGVRWGAGLGKNGGDSRPRSISKAVSWRTIGTIDTFLISWLITGHAGTATGIAATEVLTKIVLFYLHERAWDRVSWGRTAAVAGAGATLEMVSSPARS